MAQPASNQTGTPFHKTNGIRRSDTRHAHPPAVRQADPATRQDHHDGRSRPGVVIILNANWNRTKSEGPS